MNSISLASPRRSHYGCAVYTTLTRFIAALVLSALSAAALADTATYTFETPNFLNGQPLPLVTIAPNITFGPSLAGLTATFTANAVPSTFAIGASFFSAPIAGQVLIQNSIGTAGQVLQVFLSQTVLTVNLDFAINNGSGVSYLRLVDGITISDTPKTITAPFDQGHLTYTDPTGFNSFTIEAFTPANAQAEFAIDNLAFTAIPEPASAAVLSLAGAGLLGLRRRRQG